MYFQMSTGDVRLYLGHSVTLIHIVSFAKGISIKTVRIIVS